MGIRWFLFLLHEAFLRLSDIASTVCMYLNDDELGGGGGHKKKATNAGKSSQGHVRIR